MKHAHYQERNRHKNFSQLNNLQLESANHVKHLIYIKHLTTHELHLAAHALSK